MYKLFVYTFRFRILFITLFGTFLTLVIILWHNCRITILSLLPLPTRVLGCRSLLIVCFTSTKSPRGPPWNKGHRPKVCHETSVLEVPAQEQHEHSFTQVLLIRLLHVLCTRYAGIAHHWVLQTSGRGWADSKAVHGMECSGAHSLYWRSLSAGAAACSVPYCQYKEVCSPTRPNAKQANELRTKEPRVLYPGGIYSW